MSGTKIGDRLAAIDVENPSVDESRIGAALREHLEQFGMPAASITLVPDAEAGFREAARMAASGWWVAQGFGRRWHIRSPYDRSSYGLWEERSYTMFGGKDFEAADLDQEIVAAARRSVSHWRNPSRICGSPTRIWNPVLASRVALRATWDEIDAVRVSPRSSEPGWWGAERTQHELAARRSEARERVALATSLVAAVESGLFAFFVLWRRDGRYRASHVCVAVPRPRLIVTRTPSRGRTETELHAWDEPAVRWPGGSEYFYWRGLRVGRELVERPSRLTARYVVRQANVERRRVLLERLGYERFLETAGARLAQEDDFGRLWKTELLLDEEAVTVVEVANATAEPDGTYRRYFLRVPPTTRTARAAVAWTFGFEKADDYLLAAAS